MNWVTFGRFLQWKSKNNQVLANNYGPLTRRTATLILRERSTRVKVTGSSVLTIMTLTLIPDIKTKLAYNQIQVPF